MQRKSKDSPHIIELDGLRGIAILLVLVYHFWTIYIVPFGKISKIIVASTSLFWSGVDLFFVLSGFLIGGILIRNKNSTTYFKTFYTRRFTRIFPIYFLSLTLFLLIRNLNFFKQIPDLVNSPIPFWPFGLFIQNFYISISDLRPMWLAPTWSLAIEEQFYVFIPLLIFFINKQLIPYFLAITIFVSIAIKLYFGKYMPEFCTPDRYIGLMIGVMIAYFYEHDLYWKKILTHNKYLWILPILIFVLGAIILKTQKSALVIVFTWIAFFYGSILLIILSRKEGYLARLCKNSFLRFWGKYSYGIYIIHIPLYFIINFILFKESKPIINGYLDILKPLIPLFASLLIAFISFHFFEKRFLDFGKKHTY